MNGLGLLGAIMVACALVLAIVSYDGEEEDR